MSKLPYIFSLGENKLTNDYEIILDLGLQPWGNDFLKKDEVGKENMYPLQLVYCNQSELLQLSYFVPKEVMFKDHTYLSGMTRTLVTHFYSLASENLIQYNLDIVNDIILDIGGNDGSQLIQYQNLGFKNVINFESADNICEVSKKNGVPVINNFFNEETVKSTIKKGSIKLINASGVFFHLEQLHSVINGINYCLKDDGIFVVQFMYAGAMIENLNFDTIYHEHLCYYTLNSLTKLLNQYGLYLEDASYSDIHSGSIIAKFRKHKCDLTKKALELVKKDKAYNLESFKTFAKKIESRRYKLKEILQDLKNSGKRIFAYGAPVKGNTLLNYMGITNSLIDKAVEINPYKVNTYTPGSHIPVVKENKKDLPDYYLMLSHNFEKEFIENNKDIMDKGVKFIIPFPEIKII
jgi:hypothetical protein